VLLKRLARFGDYMPAFKRLRQEDREFEAA
jgi:hypothetical protein